MSAGHLTVARLQAAHAKRQREWCPDQEPDLSFRGNEMAGETGEACNVIKKLERERHGWRGSRATLSELADELADVVHTAILCAITAGIDLEPAVIAKFNATSEKNGLSARLPEEACPVCNGPLEPDDQCSIDIELGICHAACLEGSPTVNLYTGEPMPGPIPTFRYDEVDDDTQEVPAL